MIKHSSDAIYHRIGGGLALSFDEQSSHPVLLVDDQSQQTLAAFDAQGAMNLFEKLKEHRGPIKKALERINEHADKQ